MSRTEAPRSDRLVIVCDWLPPAVNAVGQYMALRAASEARAGRDVTLIGLGQGQDQIERTEFGAGRLLTVRLGCRPTPRTSLVRRALWTADANTRLVRAVHRAQKGEECEVVVTGSPPFLSYLLIVLNWLVWRRRLTYRIMDFYPEVVFAAGRLRWLRWTSRLFAMLRRGADRIEALGDDQARRLIESGLDPERISVNRLGAPVDVASERRTLERPFGPDAILLLYSGNLGVAHDPATFLESYRRHVQEGANRVRLWVNGSGQRVDEVRAYCRTHDLPLVLTSAAPLEDLAALLNTADAHLVLLGSAFWGYVHPSKVYGCVESGRPVLYFGPPEADAAVLIRDHPLSVQIDPGDSEAGFTALERLSATASAVSQA